MNKIFCLVILLVTIPCIMQAQEKFTDYSDSVPDNVLFERQWSLGAMLHSNGWGLKFRKGYNLTALKQFMWELEWSTYKSAKEVKVVNPYYSDSRPFIFGKLNYVSFLRGGVGLNYIFNRKPYWGGVQVSGLFYGGLSIGITKPAYVFVAYPPPGRIMSCESKSILLISTQIILRTGIIPRGYSGIEFLSRLIHKSRGGFRVRQQE